MKHLNKIFSVGVVSLSLTPMATTFTNTSNTTTVLLNSDSTKNVEEQDMRCTIAYVGKECTKDKQAIIARSNDATIAGNFYLKRVEHNELANTTIKNNFGFEYTYPSETYAYISSPDSLMNAPKDERHLWQNMGINENGVAISCTLTCATNYIAKAADPHQETGIAEELYNQILASSATSARNAMEIAAAIITDKGAQSSDILMATDQNETWLMEVYTGHQFLAVKLPDDMAFVAGNEFILDSLDDLGISEETKDNFIASEGLLSLAHDGGFDKYTDTSKKDIYHLDLFNTYGGETTASKPEKFRDSCHMRTWRGYSLWNASNTAYAKYEPQKKYPAMFKPDKTDMTIYDVIQVYRDEYDDILNDTTNVNYTYFKNLKDAGTLRPIPTEYAGLVHILTVNPNLPKEIAINALYCPSSANYTPFIMLNNGINSFDGEYQYCPERWSYDEKNASVLFRKLNAIAWPHREKYGLPLQEFWRGYEEICLSQTQQVLDDASKLESVSQARDILTNFNKKVRDVTIETVKNVTEDLIWHDMDQDHRAESKINPFVPLVDLELYLSELGWTDFERNENTITFKHGEDTAKLELTEGYQHETGKLTVNNIEYEIDVKVKNDKAYVGFETLNEATEGKREIVTIDINDYISKKSINHLVWILPLSIGIPAIVALAVSLVAIKRAKRDRAGK